jgi:hypothetical protein
MTVRPSLAALALALFLALSGSNGRAQERGSLPVPFAAGPASEHAPVWSGLHGGVTVVRSADQARAAGVDPAAFDWARESWLIVVDVPHPTGGYAIRIRALELDAAGRLHVVIERRSPGPRQIVTEAFTQPFDSVRAGPIPADAPVVIEDQVVSRRKGRDGSAPSDEAWPDAGDDGEGD